MSTGSAASGREELLELLRDEKRRNHLASVMTKRGLAEQIREIRRARGWTQADLAQKTDKVQETISQLENPNYGNYTLKTLQRIAEAFGVTLTVRFDPFSEMVRWMTELTPENLAVPDYEHDTGLTTDTTVTYPLHTESLSGPMFTTPESLREGYRYLATGTTFVGASPRKEMTAWGISFNVAEPTPIKRSA